jgi:hypothetical protein
VNLLRDPSPGRRSRHFDHGQECGQPDRTEVAGDSLGIACVFGRTDERPVRFFRTGRFFCAKILGQARLGQKSHAAQGYPLKSFGSLLQNFFENHFFRLKDSRITQLDVQPGRPKML